MAKKENILFSLGLDTTAFTENIKKLDREIKASASNLKEIDKALKFDPKNVELIRQKQEELNKSIELGKQKIEAFKQLQAEMKLKGISETSEAFQKLERDIVIATASVDKFKGTLEAMKAPPSLEAVGNKLKDLGDKTERISQVAMAGMAAIGTSSVMAGQYADDINTLAKVYGMTTEEIQRMKYASDLVDVSLETVAGSQKKLFASMIKAKEGSEDTQKAFSRLGIQYEENGKLLNKNDVWKNVIDALGRVSDATEREALALELMGKNASELNPLILEGADAFLKASEGLEVLSQEELDRANATADAVARLKNSFHLGTMSLGASFAPELEALATMAEKTTTTVGRAFRGLPAPVRAATVGVLGSVSALSAGLKGVGETAIAINNVRTVFESLKGITAIASIGASISKLSLGLGALQGVGVLALGAIKGAAVALAGALLSPIGIAVAIGAAVVGVGYLVYKNWDAIKKSTIALCEGIGSFFKASFQAIGNVFNWYRETYTNIFRSIGSFISNVFQNVVGFITEKFQGLLAFFQNVKNFVVNIFSGIGNAIAGAVQGVGGLLGLGKAQAPTKKASNKIPKLSVGTDLVHSEGLAYIHQGEAVVKKGTNEKYDRILSRLENINGFGDKTIIVEMNLDGSKIGRSIHRIVGGEQSGEHRRVMA